MVLNRYLQNYLNVILMFHVLIVFILDFQSLKLEKNLIFYDLVKTT